MTYAAPVWETASRNPMKKIQVIQNKSLSTVLDSTYFITKERLHADGKLEAIEEYENPCHNYQFSENSLVLQLGQHPGENLSRRRPKNILLPTPSQNPSPSDNI